MVSSNENYPNKTGWNIFGELWQDYIWGPKGNSTFVMYFLTVIVLPAIIIIFEPWIELKMEIIKKLDLIPLTIKGTCTFSVTLAMTTVINFSLSEINKTLKIVFFLMLGIVGICTFISILFGTLIPPSIGLLIALFLWWVGNANNDLFNESAPTNASMGDDLKDVNTRGIIVSPEDFRVGDK